MSKKGEIEYTCDHSQESVLQHYLLHLLHFTKTIFESSCEHLPHVGF